MHEMALAESVVEIVEHSLKQQPGAKLRVVRVTIGALSHADSDALQFCFGAVAKGTAAHGAILEIARAPGRAWCHDCRKDVSIDALGQLCPTCGGFELQIIGGDDLRVSEMEVE